MRSGKYYQALVDLDYYIELESEFPYSGQCLRYDVMLRMGRWEEIQAVIDSESSDNNHPWVAQELRGQYYLELGRLNEAEADFRALVDLAPEEYWEGYENLARVAEKRGKSGLAKEYIAKAKKIYDALPIEDRFSGPTLFKPD